MTAAETQQVADLLAERDELRKANGALRHDSASFQAQAAMVEGERDRLLAQLEMVRADRDTMTALFDDMVVERNEIVRRLAEAEAARDEVTAERDALLKIVRTAGGGL